VRYGGDQAPAWAAVCALVESAHLTFEQAENTSAYWHTRWSEWCRVRNLDNDSQ
jgi:hypothetical protein